MSQIELNRTRSAIPLVNLKRQADGTTAFQYRGPFDADSIRRVTSNPAVTTAAFERLPDTDSCTLKIHTGPEASYGAYQALVLAVTVLASIGTVESLY